MGSLPNLSELGRVPECPSAYKLGSLAGQSSHQHGHAMLTYEEKNRILHRHSGYCRNSSRIRNGGGGGNVVYDDFMLEQMAAYSPISSRSTRNLSHTVRRRDSMNSSIGATSVRRLIAVVRNTSSRCGPAYSRKILIKNLIVLCVSHTLITSTFLPFLALQGSVSVWILPSADDDDLLPVDINIGSVLLTLLNVFAALSVTLGPALVQKLGANEVMIVSYAAFAAFYAFHLYPSVYVLAPVYALLGLVLGPLSVARATYLMTLSAKLSYAFAEEDEDSKLLRRTCIIRRMSRAFQTAHDAGFIIGSILSAVIITYSFVNPIPIRTTDEVPYNLSLINLAVNEAETNCSNGVSGLGWNCTGVVVRPQVHLFPYDYDALLDAIFDADDIGDRLCGSHACPSKYPLQSNGSASPSFKVVPETAAIVLLGVYVGVCAIASLCCLAGLDKIKMFVHQDPLERSEGLAAVRAVKDSFRDARLRLAAPLALFIGVEQAFMYADFGKSYVVCTLGVHRLNLVFLCMGLLQSIAACTLSMLLRSIRRYYLIAVGFAFHTCLLLVQMLWKPIGDDPALFYVISAAWGVCNAIWEMLNYTMLTGLYADNWEPAFANSTFFRFLGLAVAFGFHGVLCNWIKVYLLAFFMVAAIIPYAWLEIKLENIRKIKNISRL